MLRKIIESKLGPMSDTQLAEVMDLATTDIKTNRVGYGKRTSLKGLVGIAESCFIAMSRGNVA